MKDDWLLSGNLSLKRVNDGIEFDGFDRIKKVDESPDDLFFFAPKLFAGNKLTAYGGYFSFEINYEGEGQLRPDPLEVRISVRELNNSFDP